MYSSRPLDPIAGAMDGHAPRQRVLPGGAGPARRRVSVLDPMAATRWPRNDEALAVESPGPIERVAVPGEVGVRAQRQHLQTRGMYQLVHQSQRPGWCAYRR